MTAALLAALAGIDGVTLGRLWDTRLESARCRRDQKTASYQRVIEQFQATYEAVRVVALTDLDEDSFKSWWSTPEQVDSRPGTARWRQCGYTAPPVSSLPQPN
ncbi:hypothetical protein [Nocardia amamiensis]|uniref:hypothetical protein n=1 Tax=Nocardia amamiensis TaxID=404578 RepID=UPI00082B96C2|nr:hypothetical protein [Nocardia amamiensis]